MRIFLCFGRVGSVCVLVFVLGLVVVSISVCFWFGALSMLLNVTFVHG